MNIVLSVEGLQKNLKLGNCPLNKLIAFNVIGGLILMFTMGLIGILIVLIIDGIVWYQSPKI